MFKVTASVNGVIRGNVVFEEREAYDWILDSMCGCYLTQCDSDMTASITSRVGTIDECIEFRHNESPHLVAFDELRGLLGIEWFKLLEFEDIGEKRSVKKSYRSEVYCEKRAF